MIYAKIFLNEKDDGIYGSLVMSAQRVDLKELKNSVLEGAYVAKCDIDRIDGVDELFHELSSLIPLNDERMKEIDQNFSILLVKEAWCKSEGSNDPEKQGVFPLIQVSPQGQNFALYVMTEDNWGKFSYLLQNGPMRLCVE